MITAVILAAGAGTRLGTLGKQGSKPMVPIAGRPLIDWVIANLREAGVTRLIVVGHPSDPRLTAFLTERHPEVTLVMQPARKGIADALRYALPMVANDIGFLACACDSLFPSADIAALIARGRQAPGDAIVGVLDMGIIATTNRSAVRCEGSRVVEIVEKPSPDRAPSGIVAMPLYWLPRSFKAYIESTTSASGEAYISTCLNTFIRAGGGVLGVTVSARAEVTTADDVAPTEAWVRQHLGHCIPNPPP